jgi:hypothetical protein
MAKCDYRECEVKCEVKAVRGYKEDVGGFMTCWCDGHEDISKHVVIFEGRFLMGEELDALL